MAFLLLLLLAGCGQLGTHKPAPPASSPAAAPLKAVYAPRLAAYQAATAPSSGWPSMTDCDGTLWAMVACLGGAKVDLSLAEQAPGELHRRPKASGECFPAGSSSTISRDPVTVYGACALLQGDRGALERVLAYASDHDGFLGEPQDLDLTFLGPNLAGIYARAIDKLGGSSGADKLPEVEVPGVKDFQQHIEVEEILFATAAQGGATGWELGLLQSLVDGSPSDALFQAALGAYTGDCTKAPALLLDPATPVPSYVRGDQPLLFADAFWLRAAAVVLGHCKES